MSIVRVTLLSFEIDAGQLPQFFSIAPFSIAKPSNPITGFNPLPSPLNAISKELFILETSLCCKPIAALAFNEVNCPALGLTGGEDSRLHEYKLRPLQPSHQSLLARVGTSSVFGLLDVFPNA